MNLTGFFCYIKILTWVPRSSALIKNSWHKLIIAGILPIIYVGSFNLSSKSQSEGFSSYLSFLALPFDRNFYSSYCLCGHWVIYSQM